MVPPWLDLQRLCLTRRPIVMAALPADLASAWGRPGAALHPGRLLEVDPDLTAHLLRSQSERL